MKHILTSNLHSFRLARASCQQWWFGGHWSSREDNKECGFWHEGWELMTAHVYFLLDVYICIFFLSKDIYVSIYYIYVLKCKAMREWCTSSIFFSLVFEQIWISILYDSLLKREIHNREIHFFLSNVLLVEKTETIHFFVCVHNRYFT